MNILLVNDYKKEIAGTETYMMNIKLELEKRGHTVAVFGTNLSKEEYIKSQKRTKFTKYLTRIYNPESLKDIKKTIASFKPDVIHIQNMFNELSPSILQASNNIPVYLTVHDTQLINPVSDQTFRTGKLCKSRTCGGCINCVGLKGTIYEFIKRKIHKHLLHNVTAFITPSKYMHSLVLEAGFSPIIMLYNGLPLYKHKELKYNTNLLYIGRLTKDKGVDYLIEALPTIVKKFPNTKLEIIGDGVDSAYFKSLVKSLHLESVVTFKHKVPYSEVEKHYNNATIVVIPSVCHDNLPSVIIEAMSIGRVVVGTNAGGIPELIEDKKTGLLINPKDSGDVASKVISLLRDEKKLKEMGENSVNKSITFSLSTHVDKLEMIYKGDNI